MKAYRFLIMTFSFVVFACFAFFAAPTVSDAALLKVADLINLEGNWTGKYTANQGETKLTLSIQKVTTAGAINAIFNFSALPTNPGVPSGSFKMTGKINLNTGRVMLKGGEWITRPANFVTVDLDGSLLADGLAIVGDVRGDGGNFGHFEIQKGSGAQSTTNVVRDLIINAPSTFSLEAGKSSTFNVSFSGMGINNVGVQTSGNGLSAKVTGANWKPYPDICAANIAIATASNFTGGTVTFELRNNDFGVIKSTPIRIQVTPQPVANISITAPDSAPPLSAGQRGMIPVAFSGQGIGRFAVQASGNGLSATVSGNIERSFDPNKGTAAIEVSASNSFKNGGTVEFRLLSNSGGIIGTKVIRVPVVIAPSFVLPVKSYGTPVKYCKDRSSSVDKSKCATYNNIFNPAHLAFDFPQGKLDYPPQEQEEKKNRQEIKAVYPGTVYKITMSGSTYGNRVVIDHGGKVYSLYGHLNDILVEQNQHVKAGERIGTMGNTGNSTGTHLHCAIWIGTATDEPGQKIENYLNMMNETPATMAGKAKGGDGNIYYDITKLVGKTKPW